MSVNDRECLLTTSRATEGEATFRVLGPVSVLAGDAEVDLGGAQRRAVLAQLALTPGRVVPSPTLVAGLWGDDPPDTARKAVQVQVSRLRAGLPHGTIATHGDGYLLDVDPLRTDLGRFEDLVARAEAQRRDGEVEAAATLLRAALGLWRGPALADVADAPFAAAASARLEGARWHALTSRIGDDLALGRHAAVVPELEALVHEHPLREELWAQLMVALYRTGRQADALRAFHRARTVLTEELGLAPGPALCDLEAAILAHDLPEVEAPGLGAGVVPTGGPVDLRPPDTLVGRDADLATLLGALDAAGRAAGPGLVAVRGEEGLGKSSLIATFAARARGRALVVAGRCREHVAVPFGPWVEVLDQLGATEALDALAGRPDDDTSAEWRRTRFFTAVVDCLRAAGRDVPLVVVLDDLHWSDDGTVALLLHALDELARDPVLVVGAWRDREVGVGHPVVRALQSAARRGAPSLELGPLTRADIADLLAALPGLDDPAVGSLDVAGHVLDVTSGVPLFVADVLSHMDPGVLERGGQDLAPQLPETARTIVDRRLSEAGSSALPVAHVAAVLSDPIAPDVVADLLPDAGLADVLHALDRLTAAGLLQDGHAGPVFAHGAFRTAVVDDIPSGRRQVLHAAVFRRLDEAGTPPAVLAHHAESAGRLVADHEAAAALRRAGADAAERGAFVDAAAFYGRAVDRTPTGERSAAQVAHADALWRAGDLATAKAVAVAVADAAAREPSQAAEHTWTDAVVLHGTIGAGYGPDDDSVRLVEDALAGVRDPVARARLHVARAYHHAAWGSPASIAHDALRRAQDALPDPCPPDLSADLGFAEGLALLDSPDLDVRRAHAEDLIAQGRHLDQWRTVGRGLRLRGMVQLSAGEVDGLGATVDALIDVAERTGSWMYESDAWRWRAARALAGHDLAGLEAAIGELERLAASPLAGWVMVGTQKVLLQRARDDLEGTLAMVDGLRASLPDTSPWQTDRRLADLYRLDLLAAMGRTDEVAAELRALRPHEELDLCSCRRYPAELALTARAVAVAGRPDEAAALAPRLAPFAGQHVVLGWGEGIIDTFDACLSALRARAASGAVPGPGAPGERTT